MVGDLEVIVRSFAGEMPEKFAMRFVRNPRSKMRRLAPITMSLVSIALGHRY